MEFSEELKTGLDGIRDEIKNHVAAEIINATKGAITTETLKENLEKLEVEGLTIKQIVEAITKHGLKINEMDAKGKEKPETIKDTLIKVYPDIIKNVRESGGKFTFKTAVSLTSITSDSVGMFIPGFAPVQSQMNAIAPSLAPFTLTADDHGVVYWTDMTTRTNNAAARSDGSAAAEQVYAWTGYSETVDNISAMVPVHKEALKHISVMENEIKTLLNDDCQVALDGYCYTGTGTAPQIGGIYTRATAFAPATYITAGGFTPIGAGLYDLVSCMAAQIMKATKYQVNKVWVNPYDALRLRLAKDADGNFLFPQYVMGNGAPMYIGNVQVIEANSVTANTLVVGDATKARLYSTGNVEIEIGYDLTGDFSKRILTILANMEASLVIRNAEVDAFLKSTDITSDIDAITKVSS